MTAAPATGAVTGPAAISDGQGGFVIDEISVAAPGPGEVRVRLRAAGVCHTDHASLCWSGPLVIGHEGAGEIEAIGEGVAHLSIGQPVLLNWAIPCGTCFQCSRTEEALCERTHEIEPARLGTSRARAGHTRWRGRNVERAFHLGTFARYTLVRAEAVTPLPPSLPIDHACVLGCAVMTGVGSAVNVAAVQNGDSVAVVGLGGVGLNVIQGARLAGAATIIAIDRRPASLERARALGATHTILTTPDNADQIALVAEVKTLSNGRGVDHAFEATGVAALAFLPLLLVRNGGNALQVSGAHGEVAAAMPDFFWSKRYLTPLYGGCVPSRDFPRLFDWIEQGSLEVASLITHHYALTNLGQAFDDMLAGNSAKGVVRID